MLSNYDCINSCWLESQGGFRYKESYFGDMIDTLRLNPAKVKKALTEKGYTVYGRFPNKKYRDGKEQVSYEDFCQELENSCCGANLLIYIGLVNLRDLYDADFKIKEVIIPKGNTCGLFSSMYGGGSLIEMELKAMSESDWIRHARTATASACDLIMNAPSMTAPSSMFMVSATPSLASR